MMDRDGVWQAIDSERASLADLLDDLSDDEWRHPSLCTAWTVRDVAAHLTLHETGVGGLLAMMTRWRGTIDRTIAHEARRRACGRITALSQLSGDGLPALTAALTP
jgi:uncharacterized protein (TIGR03083 family)